MTDYAKCVELIREVDWVYHLADIVGGVQFVFRQNILINTNVLSPCIIVMRRFYEKNLFKS